MGWKIWNFIIFELNFFSFELKNINKIDIEIRNMSPKNAMKMINIQKFCLVLFSPFCPLWSTLVLFSPLWSYWVQSVHIGPIWYILSTLVLFGPPRSYLVHFVHISLIQSTLVLFSPLRSPTVLFSPLCPLWS